MTSFSSMRGILMFLIALCSSSVHQPIRIPTFTASIENIEAKDGISHIFVKTDIINNSPDAIAYLSMSCSWDEFYFTDTNNVDIKKRQMCYLNGFEIVKISPHNKEEKILELIYKGEPETIRFKIGFNYCPINPIILMQSAHSKIRGNFILWSYRLEADIK